MSYDLLFGSRIELAAGNAGIGLVRVDDPAQLPPATSVRLALIDWAQRGPGWSTTLTGWRDQAPANERPQVLLYGPHTDLEAHAEARTAGLGPMWARSKLLADLPGLLTGAHPGVAE